MQVQFDVVACELLRALRGQRSQAVFSRRLGFRSNVAAKWESGQRMPTAADVLKHSRFSNVDMRAVLTAFHPNAASVLSGELAAPDIAAWLNALRGSQRLSSIAEQSGLSRFCVGRMLSGQAQPRLPQFLALVEALTQRVDELLDGWVGIDQIPTLQSHYRQVQAARKAMQERPLCLAVLCLLDTRPLRAEQSAAQIEQLSCVLERSAAEVVQCLQLLGEGGVIELREQRYCPKDTLTVDLHSNPVAERSLKSHWAQVAQERATQAAPLDVCSYNVFSISKQDYAALTQLQRDFYRSARALIAASEPTDMAGLLMVQMVAWSPAAIDSVQGA